jgi:hypothetical protein
MSSTFGLHLDSIAMEMGIDHGIRKKSLHSVGIAEAVSPLRKALQSNHLRPSQTLNLTNYGSNTLKPETTYERNKIC